VRPRRARASSRSNSPADAPRGRRARAAIRIASSALARLDFVNVLFPFHLFFHSIDDASRARARATPRSSSVD
jgi:hypothetical protein